MEITPALMYWIIIGPQLAIGMRIITCCIAIAFMISFLCIWVSDNFDSKYDSYKEKVKRVRKYIIVSCVAFTLCMFTILVPSTKEFAMIYVIPKVANHQAVTELPDKIIDLGMAQLEKWTKDLKGETK
jgi:hypothetical protein